MMMVYALLNKLPRLLRMNRMKVYKAGIDIGSTTVKLVLLDEQENIVFGQYRRPCLFCD